MKKLNLNLGGGASSRLKAFTLAEVLITLAIIGVVAALTIPSVVANYKNTEIESSLKSANAILSNALNMAIKDHGPIYTWDFDNGSSRSEKADYLLSTYLLPYLKVAKSCGQLETEDCKYTFFSLSGKNFNMLNQPTNDFARYYLTNGMSISALVGNANVDTVWCFLYVDINGWKKPNKMGVDIFAFNLGQTVGKKTPYRFIFSGYTNMEEDIKTGAYACSVENDTPQSGYFCTHLLRANGWKVPSKEEYIDMGGTAKGYPWY